MAEGSNTLVFMSADLASAHVTNWITVVYKIPAANNAPTVEWVVPGSDMVSLCAPVDLVLEVSASDRDGTISSVEFYVDGQLVKTVEDAGPYQYAWSESDLGDYTVTAKAYDDYGTFVVSETRLIHVVQPDYDEDTDELLNDWEEAYFGTVDGANPDDDSDGDGMSNWQEFITLTDPTNGADMFAPLSESYATVDSGEVAYGDNSILNGSFEDEAYDSEGTLMGAETAAHWAWGLPMNDGWCSGNARRSDWNAYQGSHCAIISGLWLGTNYGNMGQRCTVEAGKTYMASAFVLKEANWTAGNAFKLEFLNSSAEVIGGVTNNLSGAGITWTAIDVSGEAPESAVYAQVVIDSFNIGDTGTIYFDNIQLREQEPVMCGIYGIEIEVKSNRVYSLEYCEGLGSEWLPVQTNITSGTDQILTITDTNVTDQIRRYYRVGVRRP